jgi:hypothetical protein
MTRIFERLDGALITVAKRQWIDLSLYSAYVRPDRAENLQKVLEATVTSFRAKRSISEQQTDRDFVLIETAYQLWGETEYRLIALCYGEIIERWMEATALLIAGDPKDQRFYERVRKADATLRAFVSHILNELDLFMASGDDVHLASVLKRFRNLPSFSTSEANYSRKEREKLDALVETVWIQALMEGRVV